MVSRAPARPRGSSSRRAPPATPPQVLEPKGAFCKTQSLCWVTHGPKGEKQRHFERWLAVAVSQEGIQQLKSEPHLFGDIESGCCGGVNEHDCCIHPSG